MDSPPTDAELTTVSPAALFDLAGRRHHELFGGCTFAWEALARLPEYLQSALRLGVRGAVEDGAHLVATRKSPKAHESRLAPISAGLC